MSPPANEANALKLIERTGILAQMQIITDLNVEQDKEQSTFERILAEIAHDGRDASLISLAPKPRLMLPF